MHIDDTEGWLGIPTPLETCRQHGSLLENEIQELTIQLRQARANIFKLVAMHAEAMAERDRFAKALDKARAEISELNLETSMQGNRINSLLIVKSQCEALRQRVHEFEAKEINERRRLESQSGS
ncbi:hypothetical protein C4K22_2137 [Pseudomonas chlororaphis subsp. aurantiaca]|uniref:hypothetical protein n=1 Tax=Pseudomonas chlororaphis TaxID=587753 RepID=UPI000F56C0C5|nr:hypothetical protein [Pseudomonas chlororaphis]AZD34890.1 hypothetical protein C4K22_2137 [Pseudomonas chlororaphis subsp. aurantiaca]AZD41225.1 hypothetical protein C4K21_2141 [Pseudomonas chlororaphis subsp. aurantiaca]